MAHKATIKDLIQKQNSLHAQEAGANTIHVDANMRKLASELSDTIGNAVDPGMLEQPYAAQNESH